MRGVRRFTDLDTYKLAVELRRAVFAATAQRPAAGDRCFVEQIRDSARGGPRNIAEGFSRFVPGEFRQFLSYAKASVDETQVHIHDGVEQRYFSREAGDAMLALARRTLGGIRELMRCLASPEAQRAYEALVRAQRKKPWKKRGEPREP